MNENPNKSIQCTVTTCKHHCQGVNYCSLNTIQVGTHENKPSQTQCTDCQSFSMKAGGCC